MIIVSPAYGRDVAVHQGRHYFSQPGGPGEDWVSLDGERVAIDDLDEFYSEEIRFDWRGREFGIDQSKDGFVTGALIWYDSDWARDNGLEGNQYDGWTGRFPESEIDNVRVRRFDMLANWRHRMRTGTEAPRGTYISERPATAEEWIRE